MLCTDKTVAEHMPMVYHAYQRLCHDNHSDRDDLISEGVIGLMQAMKRYDPARGNFINYAYPRVKGAMKDYLRKVQRVTLTGLMGNAVTETKESLIDLSILPPKHRFILQKSYLEGYTHQQIADMMGVKRDSIPHAKYMALRRLKQEYVYLRTRV